MQYAKAKAFIPSIDFFFSQKLYNLWLGLATRQGGQFSLLNLLFLKHVQSRAGECRS
jgi:hypothetical protein